MVKTVLIAVLTILLSFEFSQVITYNDIIPNLAWSIDTLHLNVVANRNAWRACKKFNICGNHINWPVVWTGEVRWIA